MTTRWGIAATGGMAAAFSEDLAHVPGAEIAFVGSRSPESAAEFAGRFGAGAARAPTPTCSPPVGTARWTSSTSRRLTRSTTTSRSPRSRAARRCWSRRPSPPRSPGRRRWSTPPAPRRSSAWRRCGPASSRRSPTPASCRRAARSVTCCSCRPTSARSATTTRRAGSSTSRSAAASVLDLGVYPVSFAQHFLGRPDGVTVTGTTYANGADALGRDPPGVRRRAGRVADQLARRRDARRGRRRGHEGVDRAGAAVPPPQPDRRTPQRRRRPRSSSGCRPDAATPTRPRRCRTASRPG